MTNEIELFGDSDGLAVIGDAAAVERFLSAEGLASRDLNLPRLGSMFQTASSAAEVGELLSTNVGRWVQVSEKSAELMKTHQLMAGSSGELGRAVVTEGGKIKGIVEIVNSPGLMATLTSPAVLTGVAGIMAQVAMRQAMDEITEYLAVIDEKVDDVLRAQKDSALADMIGVYLVIEEAMTIREQMGRVSDVTWSKVQGTPMTIARTQAYALRQIDAIAEKLENKSGDLAAVSKKAESSVREWLAVLAQCFQLQDGLAVLELDRVLDSEPQTVDQHRIALRNARRNRRDVISRTTENLILRMNAAAQRANKRVLLSPFDARAVVRSTNQVTTDVIAFHKPLGIESGQALVEARKWTAAVVDTRDKVLETSALGVDAAAKLGTETLGRARVLSDKIALKATEGARRRRQGEDS